MGYPNEYHIRNGKGPCGRQLRRLVDPAGNSIFVYTKWMNLSVAIYRFAQVRKRSGGQRAHLLRLSDFALQQHKAGGDHEKYPVDIDQA